MHNASTGNDGGWWRGSLKAESVERVPMRHLHFANAVMRLARLTEGVRRGECGTCTALCFSIQSSFTHPNVYIQLFFTLHTNLCEYSRDILMRSVHTKRRRPWARCGIVDQNGNVATNRGIFYFCSLTAPNRNLNHFAIQKLNDERRHRHSTGGILQKKKVWNQSFGIRDEKRRLDDNNINTKHTPHGTQRTQRKKSEEERISFREIFAFDGIFAIGSEWQWCSCRSRRSNFVHRKTVNMEIYNSNLFI